MIGGRYPTNPRGGATIKRASYREGVAWIALNDDPGEDHALDPSEIQSMITVALLADLFGKEPYYVAVDVVRYRASHKI